MTKATQITATYEQINFVDTYVSELNPRTIINDDSIAALAENIRQVGLIHPLAGLIDAEGRTGVVAGGRRHRALALLQNDPRFHVIPVHMAPDAETARAWAASENNVREDLTPTDEIREFGAMHERGIPVPSIVTLWADLLGLAEDHPTVTSFDKLKKGEKAEKLESLFADHATRTALGLTAEQQDRISTWLPEGMA